MVRQYPHYLFVKTSSASGQDADGNWLPTAVTASFATRCREETNGSGSKLDVGGGKYIEFSSLVQIPKGTLSVKEGTTVFVTDDSEGKEVRIEGTILKFDRSQLHSRLWI